MRFATADRRPAHRVRCHAVAGRWRMDRRVRPQSGRRVLRLHRRLRRRRLVPLGRPVGPRGRHQRPAQHGRRPAAHRPERLGRRRAPAHTAERDDGVGGPRGLLQQQPARRFPERTPRQVPRVHRHTDLARRRRYIPHRHRLSQAAWRDRGAAAAVLRLRFGRRIRCPPVQLGLRSAQLQRAGRLVLDRPVRRRRAHHRMQAHDPGTARGRVQGNHGCGLQPHVFGRQLVRTHCARLLHAAQ